MNNIDLKDRIAVITGGSGDIGLATARRMLRDGAVVFALDIDDVALRKAAQDVPGLKIVQADLLVESATERALADIAEKAGRIDILVNCVGIEGVRSPVEEHDIDAWRKIMEVNVTAPVIAAKYAIRLMKRKNYGRIVFLSSAAGKDGNPFGAAYSAAKAAIMALTKSIGKELATTGIRANCVTPAAIESALFNRSASPSGRESAIARIPVGRLGEPDEVAALICWLSSEDCSFSTGGVFDVSGGRSTY